MCDNSCIICGLRVRLNNDDCCSLECSVRLKRALDNIYNKGSK